MKQLFKVLLAVCVFIIALSPAVRAGDHPQPMPDTSSAELNRIKGLAGRWTATTSMFGKPNQRVYTEYQVTSGGSTVLERIFPGTPQEMVSVYYDDDHGKLAMTHYCIMRNRPTLKLKNSSADTITMDVKNIAGLKSKNDPAMGGITIRFKDKNHIEQICSSKGKEKPMMTEYTRVR